jgi:hypothetical protein
MYFLQIPAIKPPREIHFRSEKGEIEAFVCQENLLEDATTTTTSSTTLSKENVLESMVKITQKDVIIMPDSEEESNPLFESHSKQDVSKITPVNSTIDLNSDIFWTQNELHGKFC